ncbi:UNVERIFIED_CONTAM: hypothetical protein HHA_234380 [Hammondia hammondi]|eukprot:XP_008881666.1 hypothetical protein HHA_234380 [Hammondia hammondi]
MKPQVLFGLLAGVACLREATAFSHKRSIRSVSSHSTFDQVTAETDIAPVLAEVQKTPTLVKKLKKGWRKVLEKLGIVDTVCDEKKKHKKIPSAADGDAPNKHFGYPFFDTATGKTILRPQVGLSNIEGFPQPVRVGAKDWMVQGRAEDVLALLVCFEDYDAIGEKLGEDGAWHDTGDIGPVYLQLQNVAKYQGDTASIMLSYSIEQVLGRIEAWGVIDQTLGQWWSGLNKLTDKAQSIYDTYQLLKIRVPDLTPEKFKDTWNKACEKNGTQAKLKELATLFTFNDKTRELRDAWENLERVDLESKVTLTLTSYPKRSSTMATFGFNSNRVKIGDMADAFGAAIKDDKLDNLLREYV